MNIYISFLRGVNMTGHNSIKMTDLAALYRGMDFLSPETYIQSGNVVFGCDGSLSQAKISLAIETGIRKSFGFEVPVMVRSIPEMRKILTLNPFLQEINFDPAKTAVIFLQEGLTEAQIEKVAGVDYPPDKFKIIGQEIYTFCPNGFGKTKLYTNFFENKMKVKGTARNWKTITTLLGLAEKRL
jgi:uncharacterized protein (DUF1697 family)